MADADKTETVSEAPPATATASVISNISQARLHTIIAGLWFCLFISALDTTIVTTALIKISSGFNALEQAAWLVTAYLLTYNSFLMITAKLSDVWGLKILMLASAIIFLIFSMACGSAQTMVQLIVFRAFQGIGGSGLYSLTFVAIMKLVSPDKIGFYSGIISSVFAMANLLGPLFGGIISDRTTWRWIFFINGPIVAIAIVLLFFSMPTLKDGKSNSERVRSLDSVGGLLSIGWPIPLIFALQEAGGAHAWSSGVIIGTLVTGIVLLIVFVLYETWVTYRTKTDPIFPVNFIRNPPMALSLLSMFLLGMPFYVVFVQLPQRFQTVNFTSAERAGILLLPATLVSPVGAMMAGLAAKRIPIEFVLIFSIAVISVGIGLLGSLPTYPHLWPGLYGYEIITGLGLGLASPCYYMLISTSVMEKEVSVATGALNMMRTLGGAVAVAICSAIHRGYLKDKLSGFLTPEQMAAVQTSSGSIAQLGGEMKQQIGTVFGGSYNRQFLIMLVFTNLNFIVAIILAVVRKKVGLFGAIPERKEENEFMKAAEKKGQDEEAKAVQPEAVNVVETSTANSELDPDTISAVRADEEKKIG